jgi:predicted nucleic acid-binding protein
MKELIEQLKHVDMNNAKDYVLLDTCFIIHTFEHQKEHQLKELLDKFNVGITSFNAEEFIYNDHKVDERVRENMRRLIKKHPQLTIISANVHPGDRQGEKDFVNSIDPELLTEIPDASDAVLMAIAMKTHSKVLTKDKHHLFTVKLENYLNKHDLEVHKDYNDLLK